MNWAPDAHVETDCKEVNKYRDKLITEKSAAEKESSLRQDCYWGEAL